MHQAFRLYESYNFLLHVGLLIIPPSLIALSTTTPTSPHAILGPLALSFTTHLSTLALSIILYRVSSLHPLSRFPGPLGCKVSKLWMAVISRSGYQHRYYKALHERYGNIVRIGAWLCIILISLLNLLPCPFMSTSSPASPRTSRPLPPLIARTIAHPTHRPQRTFHTRPVSCPASTRPARRPEGPSCVFH